jgi:hypothetical protein
MYYVCALYANQLKRHIDKECFQERCLHVIKDLIICDYLQIYKFIMKTTTTENRTNNNKSISQEVNFKFQKSLFNQMRTFRSIFSLSFSMFNIIFAIHNNENKGTI